jgi:hypothetical protein
MLLEGDEITVKHRVLLEQPRADVASVLDNPIGSCCLAPSGDDSWVALEPKRRVKKPKFVDAEHKQFQESAAPSNPKRRRNAEGGGLAEAGPVALASSGSRLHVPPPPLPPPLDLPRDPPGDVDKDDVSDDDPVVAVHEVLEDGSESEEDRDSVLNGGGSFDNSADGEADDNDDGPNDGAVGGAASGSGSEPPRAPDLPPVHLASSASGSALALATAPAALPSAAASGSDMPAVPEVPGLLRDARMSGHIRSQQLPKLSPASTLDGEGLVGRMSQGGCLSVCPRILGTAQCVGGGRARAEDRAAPGDFSYKWGPFLMSKLRPNGVFSGWGATCGRHVDPGCMRRCKTSIEFGKEGLSSEDCQLRLKRWLILGHDLDRRTGDDGHMSVKARQCTEGLSLEDLEAAKDVI